MADLRHRVCYMHIVHMYHTGKTSRRELSQNRTIGILNGKLGIFPIISKLFLGKL